MLDCPPVQTYWLSFADDTGFRGVVLVDCATMAEAHRLVTAHGVNLGGEIAGFPFQSDDPRMDADDRARMAALPRLTPIYRPQLDASGLGGQTFAEAEATGDYDVAAAKAAMDVICADCNAGQCARHH